MKRFGLGGTFILIMAIVTFCALIIQLIVYSANKSNTKSWLDGHTCTYCGAEAKHTTPPIDGARKYYCDKCYEEYCSTKYEDLPVATFPQKSY